MENIDENKNQVENQEIVKPIIEAQAEKEISKEELSNFLDTEEQNFKQETQEEVKNLNSIGLDEPTFEQVKNENNIESELHGMDNEMKIIVDESKNEIQNENKETLENKIEVVDQIETLSKQEYLSKESIKSVEIVLEAENSLHIAQERLNDLHKNMHEMMPEEYKIKTQCAEIEILKARGDILINKKDISDDVIEKFKEESKNKKTERVIAGYGENKKEENEKKEKIIKNIDSLSQKIESFGYDLDSVENLRNSDDTKDKEKFAELEKFADSLDLAQDFGTILTTSPNLMIDSIDEVKMPLFQKEIFYECIDNKDVYTQKIVDVAFSKIMNDENKRGILENLENRLSKDKQEALKNLPVDEILDSWEKDIPKTSGWDYSEDNKKVFAEKIGQEIDDLIKRGKFEEITKIQERIENLNTKTENVPYFSQARPKWLKDLFLNDRDSLELITKNLNKESFKYYFEINNTFIPPQLIPDSFSKEEKEAYYSRVFQKKDISGNDILEYCTLVNKDILEVINEDQRALFAVLKSPDIRKTMTPKLHAHFEDKNNSSESVKYAHTKNILDSFLVKENPGELPPEIFETLENFENNYGDKGRDLIALAVSSYGIENPESFKKKMESMAQVLDKYNPDTIPDGAKVSMGVEYEATSSISDKYQETSAIGYKNDAMLLSDSANLGKGKDGVHEFALKPNYNPYMIMAEMKLLQEGGFLDLNFENYDKAPRGYHLSLVGDSGLFVDENMFFLNNVMTMTQMTGITAGKQINNTKNIHSKSFESFSNSHQRGERCEIKGMATDSVEQFEKAIITAHHAGIAIQLSNKYIPNTVHFLEMGNNAEEFEKMLVETNSLGTPFESDQERDMVYEWTKFKKMTVDSIDQHNKSFVDSEFNGSFLDKEGNYIDTSEHIDIMRNKKLVDENILKSQEFEDKIHLNAGDMFESQKTEFVNALTNTNNIFLKSPQADENSSVNVKSVLDTMKKENYGGVLEGRAQESIFENGGNFRDGYNYTQGASEEMIIHKSQILLNHFNKNMDMLLQKKGVDRFKQERSKEWLNADFT